MTTTFPAIRGRMGSTEYFQVTARARDLASAVVPASELEAWGQWTIAERFQREIGLRRVQEELVPYLVRSKDRFFGSIIVLAYEPSLFEFEPLGTAGIGSPAAYAGIAERMGFLTIEGGTLVALDGQHRLVALREIVGGRADELGEYSAAIGDDEVSVMFIHHESLEKTRRIFNKVNRHARPTTTTDNIITSEDDGYSIVARWLVEADPPLGLDDPPPPLALFDSRGDPLVEWRSASLTPTSDKLTTLASVCQITEVILDANGLTRFGERHRVNRPPNDELERAYRWAAEWWQVVLAEFDPFVRAIQQPWRIPDLRRAGARWSLVLRPIAQVALFRGLALAVQVGVPLLDAVRRANEVNWRSDAEHWIDTIIRANGRMIAKEEAIRLTGRVIGYLIAADHMSPVTTNAIAADYRAATQRSVSLPAPVT